MYLQFLSILINLVSCLIADFRVGDSGVKELESRPIGKKAQEAPDLEAAFVRKQTRVYFPSKHTVKTSIAKVSLQLRILFRGDLPLLPMLT